MQPFVIFAITHRSRDHQSSYHSSDSTPQWAAATTNRARDHQSPDHSSDSTPQWAAATTNRARDHQSSGHSSDSTPQWAAATTNRGARPPIAGSQLRFNTAMGGRDHQSRRVIVDSPRP